MEYKHTKSVSILDGAQLGLAVQVHNYNVNADRRCEKVLDSSRGGEESIR